MERIRQYAEFVHFLLSKGLNLETDGNNAKAASYYEAVLTNADELLVQMDLFDGFSPERAGLQNRMKGFIDSARGHLKSVKKSPADDKKGDPKARELVEGEMMEKRPNLRWNDVAGMRETKLALTEMVLLPSFRRDIYTGLRAPPRGLLLFGPPENGKTFIARAVATEARATFFSVSSSTIMASLVGDSEKLVRALFLVARERAPSIIFIDEVDGLLSSRSSRESEVDRKVKTEFLVQMDGFGSSKDDQVVVMAATNRPEDLDEAARRRFPKRIYVPLPDAATRRELIVNTMVKVKHDLKDIDFDAIAADGFTGGFSGSDLLQLCTEAAMYPLRDIGKDITTVRAVDINPVTVVHFENARAVIKPSVDGEQIAGLEAWNEKFGTV
jgi:SpoVK/Ycf46/Vps4 family AAA+-type ATPase